MKSLYIYILIVIVILFIYFSFHKKCYDPNGYVSTDYDLQYIHRKVYKCILDKKQTKKLFHLKDILVPSMINNTYCDYLTSTYYDIKDFVLTNQYNSYYMVRIRSYLFNPQRFLELKNNHNKIRFKITKKYELMNVHEVDEKYIKPVKEFLLKIKNKKIRPLFVNTYTRYSYIYLRNPDIRITIDTNICFIKNGDSHTIKENIMEIKIPYNIQEYDVKKYLENINHSIHENLQIQPFSKVKYFNSLYKGNIIIN